MINTESIITFSSSVEEIAETHQVTYLEAIMEYIELKRLDIELVPKLISPHLKQRLERESMELNLIRREKKLNGLV